MRTQRLEHDNIKNINFIQKIIIPVFTGIIIFFASCERNDIEKINEITSESNAPAVAVTNTEIVFTKNALIEVKVKSPQINRYSNIEKPYTEFPKGLYVEFYDSTQKVTSYITADYCIYDETEETWTAEHDVVSVSELGDTLNTEYLIWNQKKGKIYSDRYVRMTNQDGIIHGKGFEADQDLTNWTIKQPSGTISVKDEN